MVDVGFTDTYAVNHLCVEPDKSQRMNLACILYMNSPRVHLRFQSDHTSTLQQVYHDTAFLSVQELSSTPAHVLDVGDSLSDDGVLFKLTNGKSPAPDIYTSPIHAFTDNQVHTLWVEQGFTTRFSKTSLDMLTIRF